jgi:hypothetical protein
VTILIMETKESRPKFEKLAKVLIGLYIIGIVTQYFFSVKLSSILSMQEMGEYKSYLHVLSIAHVLSAALINIVIAWWLYSKSESTKWGWALLGLIFGILAVILFYLEKIYNARSKATDAIDKTI